MTITDAGGSVWGWTYTYDGLGRLSRVTYPWNAFGTAGGFTDYLYDLEGRLTIQHGPKIDTAYTCNARGQLIDLVNLSTWPGDNYLDPYDHQQHKMLSHFSNFQYDVFGHRLAMQSSLPPVPQQSRLMPSACVPVSR